MKPAVIYAPGTPEVLQYEEGPDPVIDAEGALIEVAAISIEGGDIASGRQVPVANTPHIVGFAAAGVVRAAGAAV